MKKKKEGLEEISNLTEGATFGNTLYDIVYFLGKDVVGLSSTAQKKLKKEVGFGKKLPADALPSIKAAFAAWKAEVKG